MFCKNCGASIDDWQKFCTKCGEPIVNEEPKKEEVKVDEQKVISFENVNPIIIGSKDGGGSSGDVEIVDFDSNEYENSQSENADAKKKKKLPLIPIIVSMVVLVAIAIFLKLGNNSTGNNSSHLSNKNSAGGKSLSLSEAINKANIVSNYHSSSMVEDFDTVNFGSYNTKGPIRGDIEWIVLNKSTTADGKRYALLLSKYAIDCMQYYPLYDYVFWETSTIRQWLNNSFYNDAFSGSEKDKIIDLPIDNPRNAVYPQADGGMSTVDKVFLLSFYECLTYFGGEINGRNLKLATKATQYAIEKGAYRHMSGGVDDGNTMFWLRSPGSTKKNACDISPSGYLNYAGNMVNLPQGIRPAIYVWY